MTLHEIDLEIRSIDIRIQQMWTDMPDGRENWPEEDKHILERLEKAKLKMESYWWQIFADLERAKLTVKVPNREMNSQAESRTQIPDFE